ncbi:hypothetical protein AB0B31_25405 [Catellatospora citrea]|uniref:hypothetical protein n=1 Tax=Catellatospora citrea TaxID=53366 RepID=UPI0033FD6394
MHRLLVGATLAAAILGAASGCTDEPVRPDTIAPPTASAAPTTPTPQATASGAAGDLRQWLPDDRVILVEPISGDADTTLPAFSTDQGEFTIYFTCTGTGTLALLVNDNDPATYPCNGVRNTVTVYTDVKGPQTVKLDVTGSGSWQLAVAKAA